MDSFGGAGMNQELDLVRAAGLGLLGLVAGTMSGLLGIGGAIIIIPALVFIFGFTQKLAQGTTLLLMIPPIGLLAALSYWKAGDVDIRAAVIIAVFFFAGGYLGGKLGLTLDEALLRKVFSVFLVGVAVKMFFE
jgi:uncharacterized membrane protein YfcA